jgi:hypothetical protein
MKTITSIPGGGELFTNTSPSLFFTNTTMAKTTETREFKTHPRLLWDVIQRQAGSVSKAILEGVMNAADAKATHCVISLDENQLLIKDDGHGFRNREAIERGFEVFGMPQDEIEQAEKTYGHFRMGRGQLFAFGANEWKTGEFRMSVDLKKAAGEKDYKIPYVLSTGNPNTPGCVVRVKLYDRMTLATIDDVQRDMEKWCKWAPIKVYFNDVLVSKDPAQSDHWDHVTDEAYIKLNNSGSLSLYNLGIHVCEFPKHKFGAGGDVVSRKQVKVNFARNDVQSDCAVWKKIRPFVVTQATKRNTGAKTLDDAERQRLADQIKRKEITGDSIRKLKLITAVTGRHFSMNDLNYGGHFRAYSNAPKGDRLGDNIMRSGLAFVVADETLERFEFDTVPQMIKWFKVNVFDKSYETDAFRKPFKPMAKLKEDFSMRLTVINEDQYTEQEKLWMSVLQNAASHLLVDGETVYGYGNGTRKLLLGDADTADGWTDGETYVVVNRKYLAKYNLDVKGVINLGNLLAHEACHGENDSVDHDHDQSFYERFHDTANNHMGAFAHAAMAAVLTTASRMGRR